MTRSRFGCPKKGTNFSDLRRQRDNGVKSGTALPVRHRTTALPLAFSEWFRAQTGATAETLGREKGLPETPQLGFETGHQGIDLGALLPNQAPVEGARSREDRTEVGRDDRCDADGHGQPGRIGER